MQLKGELVISKIPMMTPVEYPFIERYVLGGINSLRGFRYVGPTNPGTEDVIGGTTMLVFNFELVFPLY